VKSTTARRRCADGQAARLEKRPEAPIFIDPGDPGAPDNEERKRERLRSPIAAFRTSWRVGPEWAKMANSSDFSSTMFSRCSGAPKSLSEGTVSGPDKLQKTVAPPGGAERGAIRYMGVAGLLNPGDNLN
jgi:hypothetical protein